MTEYIKYNFLDDITQADYAFDAYGKTLEELFINCALAFLEIIANPNSIKTPIKREFQISSESPDLLLREFLNELIFLKDVEFILFKEFEINIIKNAPIYNLNVICKGDNINPQKQELFHDVKAITYHKYKVECNDSGLWHARIILDV